MHVRLLAVYGDVEVGEHDLDEMRVAGDEEYRPDVAQVDAGLAEQLRRQLAAALEQRLRVEDADDPIGWSVAQTGSVDRYRFDVARQIEHVGRRAELLFRFGYRNALGAAVLFDCGDVSALHDRRVQRAAL